MLTQGTTLVRQLYRISCPLILLHVIDRIPNARLFVLNGSYFHTTIHVFTGRYDKIRFVTRKSALYILNSYRCFCVIWCLFITRI